MAHPAEHGVVLWRGSNLSNTAPGLSDETLQNWTNVGKLLISLNYFKIPNRFPTMQDCPAHPLTKNYKIMIYRFELQQHLSQGIKRDPTWALQN